MPDQFVLRGNQCFLRSDAEMLTVDKAAADAAFKTCNREILVPYLLQQGFLKWKTNSYVRKSGIDLLEYIGTQKEGYGSKTFTINCAIMPLYVPSEYMILGFGDRLGHFVSGQDIWWDFSTEEAARVSFQNVTQAIGQFVMPWFRYYHDEENYRERMEQDLMDPFCGYDCKLWLSAIQGRGGTDEVILQNIRRLKLPAKLMLK